MLPIIDEITINADGTLTGWACALNDLSVEGTERVKLKECAAPRGECPRGFGRAFECKEGGRDLSASVPTVSSKEVEL
jgi:hypothetical protein